MTYAVATMVNAGPTCSNCKEQLESRAKFCGGCGFIVAPDSFSIQDYQSSRMDHKPVALPSFAVPKKAVSRNRLNELNEEIEKITLSLTRERLLLCLQLVCFLAVNLFGFWVAWKCYFDFLGDEMSRMMMASTPFLFINSVALVILAPIKGTRAEIARLKERLSYVRFNLEFGHLDM